MKNAVIKRINEGKKIEEIGAELCEGLKYPKRKIIDIIIETKGETYLNENKKQLGYRGGGGAGKPRKPKKTELQNFAAQAEPNLSESESEKKCKDGDNKVQNEEDDNGDDFDAPQECSIIHDKKYDVLNLDELDEEKLNKIIELLEPVIIKNKDILKEIRLSFKFDKNDENLASEIRLYKR